MSSIKKITFIFLFIEKLFDNNFNILRKKGKKKKELEFCKIDFKLYQLPRLFQIGLILIRIKLYSLMMRRRATIPDQPVGFVSTDRWQQYKVYGSKLTALAWGKDEKLTVLT